MSSILPGRIPDQVNTSAYPAGLTNAFRITTMTVPDTATALPATPLTDRVAISVTNLDATEILYIGNSDVTADRALGTTAGWEVGPGESFNVDVTDSIIIYGRAEASQTILIKVLEIS